MNLEILCTQVQELAREVGRFIFDERLKFTAEDIIHKGKADMVTYVDKTAETRILSLPLKNVRGIEIEHIVKPSKIIFTRL